MCSECGYDYSHPPCDNCGESWEECDCGHYKAVELEDLEEEWQ
jgi:hypothetical protein